MSAAGAFCRLRSLPILVLVASVLPLVGMTQSIGAEQKTGPSTTASVLASWDGESTVTLDELKLHATEIGKLLDHASARVDRLADEASDQSAGRALVDAIRQELDLSRQWNGHLTSILLEVAEARRALGVREQKAAAEIFELTSIAEEARLELIALWKSLKPGMSVPFGEHDLLPAPKPETEQPSVRKGDKGRIEAVTEELAGPDATIDEARRVLDEMGAMQKTAAGDIEAVRTKIIEALHTLAPHRTAPLKGDMPKGGQIEGGLSSKEVTAWAASIASKLHHEGFEDVEQARDTVESIRISTPGVEDMVMEGEALSTTAVRIAPDRRATPIATVMAGSLILVTGKVINQDWYRVEIEGGRHGFVSGGLIRRQSAPMKPARRVKPS